MRADRLFRTFILRPLLQERIRTLTTVVGIALGVGVVVAIQLTNASSVRGFETALDTVAGKATIEIVGRGGIDETWLTALGWLRKFGAASPVIEGEMALIQGDEARVVRRAEALKVLGVDILRDLTLRDYVVAAADRVTSAGDPSRRDGAAELTEQQFLELLTSPQSVVITEKLARRRGLALGSEVRLVAGDRVNTFVVRGLLADEGPARVMDGGFVLMDIAAAQLAFDRLGRIDRVDVRLDKTSADSAAIDTALAEIGKLLPTGLSAQRPSRRGQQVEQMLAAFHLNLTALSWVALVVGLFLVYNTVTISVIARREEIGTLRALGVTRGRVLRLFLGEAAALGIAGTVLGIAAGRLFADLALWADERHRPHHLHRVGGGAARSHLDACRPRLRRRRSPLAGRGVAPRTRGEPRSPDDGDSGTRRDREPRAILVAIAAATRRRPGRRVRARPVGARRWPPTLRIRVVVCDHPRCRAARARADLRIGSLSGAAAAPCPWY